jgi:hypothetical protein
MFVRADFKAAFLEADEMDGLVNLAGEHDFAGFTQQRDDVFEIADGVFALDLRLRCQCGLCRAFA